MNKTFTVLLIDTSGEARIIQNWLNSRDADLCACSVQWALRHIGWQTDYPTQFVDNPELYSALRKGHESLKIKIVEE